MNQVREDYLRRRRLAAQGAAWQDQSSGLQLGMWYWKDETKTLEFRSFTPAVELKEKARKGRAVHFAEIDGAPADRLTDKRFASRDAKSLQALEKRGQQGNVSLQDAKFVALLLLQESEMQRICSFTTFMKNKNLDNFLMALLYYLSHFLEKISLEKKPKSCMVGLIEKKEMELVLSKLEAAQKYLAHRYCVLVLGVGMPDKHHMCCGNLETTSNCGEFSATSDANGELSVDFVIIGAKGNLSTIPVPGWTVLAHFREILVFLSHRMHHHPLFSCLWMPLEENQYRAHYPPLTQGTSCREKISDTQKDWKFFESFYTFCTYVAWIVFRRQHFIDIEEEIGRLFRTNMFNIPRRKREDEELGREKKRMTFVQFRRMMAKRPAIKTAIHMRSPVMSTLLPSLREKAQNILEKKYYQVGTQFPAEMQKQMENLESVPMPTVGILGEPRCLFNPYTLLPLEPEENMKSSVRQSFMMERDHMRLPDTPGLETRTRSSSQTRLPE